MPISSKLDYWALLFYGLPKYLIQRLQHVLNTAARIVTLSMKHEHISPIPNMLHCLPVEQRIHFKLILTNFNALHGQAPDYIRDLLKQIEEYRPSRYLRSDNFMLYLSLILTWFIMEGKHLVMQPPGFGIPSQ